MNLPSPQFSLWHGIAREIIPWFPTVNHDKCIGCELCFVTCRRGLVRENQLVLINESRI